MDSRATKLALARKKLKDHQEKRNLEIKDDGSEKPYLEDVMDKTNSDPGKSKPKLVEEPYEDVAGHNTDVTGLNVTEILVSSKRHLEIQVTDLESKLSQFENNQARLLNENIVYRERLAALEQRSENINEKYLLVSQEIVSKNKYIDELLALKDKLVDENSNLCEQLELAKCMLTEKETQIFTINNQVQSLKNKLETTNLQLKQLTNGNKEPVEEDVSYKDSKTNTDILLQNISVMEQKLKEIQQDKDDMGIHYEHYVDELNEQIKSLIFKNQEYSSEIEVLSKREKELADHISELEIRLQNYKLQSDLAKEQMQKVVVSDENNETDLKYNKIQEKIKQRNERYNEVQKNLCESEKKLLEMRDGNKSELDYDKISFSKLQADITSDKVALQRATEQNKKMKIDLQKLEEAFVKMSKDKLELTEKLDAEKFLNRALTIKLAEMEEKYKDVFHKLSAKDEEMMRLQSCLRETETVNEKKSEKETVSLNETNFAINELEKIEIKENNKELKRKDDCEPVLDKFKSHNSNAMLKLQERFLKIMEEVANLSDEKHRLEHIILQLQNETETICEYVALYQQQRSLLRRRDEERSAQIKIFQAECDLLKRQLDELSSIIVRLTEDKELSAYFHTESCQNDIVSMMNLLEKLKSNSIVDSHKTFSELNNFYPCSCCLGQLKDV